MISEPRAINRYMPKAHMFYLAVALLSLSLWSDWLVIRDWRGGPLLKQEGENVGTYMLGGAAATASKAVLPISCFALTALSLDVLLVELEGRLPSSLGHLAHPERLKRRALRQDTRSAAGSDVADAARPVSEAGTAASLGLRRADRQWRWPAAGRLPRRPPMSPTPPTRRC